MQRFACLIASLYWFFIGYWILKRGWISIRPLFLVLVNAIADAYHPIISNTSLLSRIVHVFPKGMSLAGGWGFLPIFAH